MPRSTHLITTHRCLRSAHTSHCLFRRLQISHFIPKHGRSASRNPFSTHRTQESHRVLLSSSRLAGICIASSIVATIFYQSLRRPENNDAPSGNPLSSQIAKEAKIDVIKPVHKVEEADQVSTGTSTVPFFPRKIWLPRSGATDDGKSRTLPAGVGTIAQDEEYHLLGLGIRTVSFLSIQVYVVGLYVAHNDLSKLQEAMVRAAASPGATTLVEGEKDTLKHTLIDSIGSEKIWGEILSQNGIKSALRIVPTRSTDFGHLRDGWVRGITARSKGADFADEGFKTAVGDFKALFGGRKLAKGKSLLLGRGSNGVLKVWVETDDEARDAGHATAMVPMGGVADERISRLVWLGYLAGANVASEGARKSVVDGVLELVERPIGTVDTQVV